MRNKNLKIIKELIKLNGEDSTFDKVAEECIELALAIMQLKCPTKLDKKKRLNDVYLEAADVKIQMKALEIILSSRKINNMVNKKLAKKQLKYLSKNKTNEKDILPSRRPSKRQDVVKSKRKK
ncbi:hypothetical protein Phi47:1_gp67 [Cellulophaga phage phi47:1]|nr:hypothetical protein Phi3ST:2_gp67 [Cellulophaga phage phi3ST:2]AGO49306.1 hypothetical protein Phi38:2_gp67 [Cellulophaga phage phi38:2]AGO49804.1 hypothetical protein Phi47:1_gp67 [Cellulophaga phage phi47:1]